MLMQWILFGIVMICAIVVWSVLMMCWCKGVKLWTSGTNDEVKALLEEERETIRKISNKINNAGAVNKWWIRRQLGPKLYDWYSKQG